jgi:hypothetical protein
MFRYRYLYKGEYVPVYGVEREEALRNAVLDTYYRFYKNYNYKVHLGKNYYLEDKKTAEYLLKYLSGRIPIKITNDNGEFLAILKESYSSLSLFPERKIPQAFSKEEGFGGLFRKQSDYPKQESFVGLFNKQSDYPKQDSFVGLFNKQSDSSDESSTQGKFTGLFNEESSKQSYSEESLGRSNNSNESNDSIFVKSNMEYEPTERENLPYYSIKETEMIKAMMSKDPDLIRLFSKEDYLRFQRNNCSIEDLPYARYRYKYVGDHAIFEGIRHVWKTREVGRNGYQASNYCRAAANVLEQYF